MVFDVGDRLNSVVRIQELNCSGTPKRVVRVSGGVATVVGGNLKHALADAGIRVNVFDLIGQELPLRSRLH